MSLAQLAPSAGAAFLASLVECVEAATILLAVGTVRGWRSAFAGLAALLLLTPGLAHRSRPPRQGALSSRRWSGAEGTSGPSRENSE